jgi:hypothetical protein
LFGKENGYDFVEIDILQNKMGQPSGSAAIAIQNNDDLTIEQIIHSFQDQYCNGRLVRVSTFHTSKFRMSSDGSASRYYRGITNMHIKCNNCGEVGHREKDCNNPTVPPPCHLCAGRDHEAGMYGNRIHQIMN